MPHSNKYQASSGEGWLGVGRQDKAAFLLWLQGAHQAGLTAAEQRRKAESSHGTDVSQDFGLIWTLSTFKTHQITQTPQTLACHAQRKRLQSLTKASWPISKKRWASSHICTTVPWKDPTNTASDTGFHLGKDKVILQQTNKSVHTQQQERSGAVSTKHIQDCLAIYKCMRLTVIITIWNMRTLKVAKSVVTAGISRHCFWKARFYLSGKSSKKRKRRHALQQNRSHQLSLRSRKSDQKQTVSQKLDSST